MAKNSDTVAIGTNVWTLMINRNDGKAYVHGVYVDKWDAHDHGGDIVEEMFSAVSYEVNCCLLFGRKIK
jgi:hypothetical protein